MTDLDPVSVDLDPVAVAAVATTPKLIESSRSRSSDRRAESPDVWRRCGLSPNDFGHWSNITTVIRLTVLSLLQMKLSTRTSL